MTVNSPIVRRPTRKVMVGHVPVGGNAPVVVQSMTNTDTADVAGTVAQVSALWQAGSELVRLTVNTEEAARAVPAIREQLDAQGCTVPLIGDFHFNGHKLLTQVPECAQALAKLRINPGNIGRGSKRDEQFAMLIEIACRHDKPVRIGVNWGSLDQAVLARIMDENAKRAEPRVPFGQVIEAGFIHPGAWLVAPNGKRARVRADCFKAFRHNNWFGALVFAGIFVDQWLRAA